MYLNEHVKRMILVALMLINLLLIGCNKEAIDKQPNERGESITESKSGIEIKDTNQAVTTETTSQPTIDAKIPTPTVEPVSELTISNPILIAKKSERILELWDGESLIDCFDIDIGKTPEGDKKVQGDCKTPEGEYYIGYKNPNSHYYLSLGIAYPNKEDAREALDNGQIDQTTYDSIAQAIDNGRQPPANTILGSGITVHGRVDDQRWTRGCIAVDNEVMDILWDVCPVGTKITIYE